MQCKGAFKPRNIELESFENTQSFTDDEVAQMTDNVYTNQSEVDIESNTTLLHQGMGFAIKNVKA